jgi:aryl-alcohol dehydrogenase-like predicted oxidoreductase
LKKLKAAQEALAPLDLASNQMRYSLLDRRIEHEILPYANNEKITIIAYSPLAQGLLTGRPISDTRPSSFIQTVNPGFSTRNLATLTKTNRILSEIAMTHGKTASQVALNWLTRKDNVVAIPGVKIAAHVIDDAGAVDWTLNGREIESLEQAVNEVRFDRLSMVPNLLRSLRRA